MDTVAKHRGSYSKLVNTAAGRDGSIHDDGAAQALGFRRAFVPGSVVGQKALIAATALLGDRWQGAGWYDLTFVSPVYEDEEVRDAGELTDGEALIRVETAEGRLCCAGRAGVGFSIPWDRAKDGLRGAEQVLPRVEVGMDFGEHGFRLAADDVRGLVRACGDESPWYQTASPWGDPIIPPEELPVVALGMVRTRAVPVEGIRGPGIWAAHLVALREPLFLGRPYVMTETIVDKGVSGRTIFLTYEFHVSGADGNEVAAGRHVAKWLRAEPAE